MGPLLSLCGSLNYAVAIVQKSTHLYFNISQAPCTEFLETRDLFFTITLPQEARVLQVYTVVETTKAYAFLAIRDNIIIPITLWSLQLPKQQ